MVTTGQHILGCHQHTNAQRTVGLDQEDNVSNIQEKCNTTHVCQGQLQGVIMTSATNSITSCLNYVLLHLGPCQSSNKIATLLMHNFITKQIYLGNCLFSMAHNCK